jgi:hypothetical protein
MMCHDLEQEEATLAEITGTTEHTMQMKRSPRLLKSIRRVCQTMIQRVPGLRRKVSDHRIPVDSADDAQYLPPRSSTLGRIKGCLGRRTMNDVRELLTDGS